MYIQEYFKNGKLKKTVKEIDSIKSLMDLFEGMLNGKDVPFEMVTNNFYRRDIVFDDGTKQNLWCVMKENGFEIALPF